MSIPGVTRFSWRLILISSANTMIMIETSRLGDILHLQQDVSNINASRVKNELLAIVNASNCDCLWLDMGQVNFMDGAGLRVIAATYSLVKQQNRNLILCKVNPPVSLVFELTGLDQVFRFSNTTPNSASLEFGHFNEQWPKIQFPLSAN